MPRETLATSLTVPGACVSAGTFRGMCKKIDHFPEDADYEQDTAEYLLRKSALALRILDPSRWGLGVPTARVGECTRPSCWNRGSSFPQDPTAPSRCGRLHPPLPLLPGGLCERSSVISDQRLGVSLSPFSSPPASPGPRPVRRCS